MNSYVSGIQPSGDLHLGNYFGAIKQHLELQHEPGNHYYFIADYHALTSLKDGKRLRDFTRQIAATYVALGLNTKKAMLFKQSSVPQVQELAWMLKCVVGVGTLQRCHAFKDKIAQGLMPNAGLLTYPVLMAADILIYGGTVVPVGKDQIQHVELAKDLAGSFNAAFKEEILRQPQAKINNTPLVPGTDGRKMSKSYRNTISIFASKKQRRKEVNSIVTDSRDPKKLELDPNTCRAYAIFKLMANEHQQALLCRRYLEDRDFPGYGETKNLVIKCLDLKFGEAQEYYQELIDPRNPEIDRILEQGAERAREIAQSVLNRCRRVAGL